MRKTLFYFYFVFFPICIFSQIVPTDIPGCKLWLKADAGITLNGSNVSAWDDQSGNSNHATQASVASQPLFIANVLNTLPVLHFDGTDDILNGVTIPNINTSDITIFVVTKGEPQSGIATAFFEINDYSTGFTFDRHLLSESLIIQNNGSSFSASGTLPNSGFNFKILEGIKKYGTQTELFINSISQGISTDANLNSTFTNGNYHIGYFSGYNYLNGDIAEIIVYDQALSTTDRQNVENYLYIKYGSKVDLGLDIDTASFCSITLDAGSQFINYLWSTGETTDTIIIDTSGSYSVTVTNIFGLTSYDTITINYPTPIILHDTFFCFGNSVTLSTGLGSAFNYNWSNTETTETINITTPGDYSVTVTDAGSCTRISDTITVEEDDFPITANLGPSTLDLCSGNSIGLITPDPLPPGLNYMWTGGFNTSSITVTTSGDYYVTVTDSNSCVANDNIHVNIIGTAPAVDFNYNSPACSNNAVQFNDNSALTATTWLWDFGDGQTSTDENPVNIFAAPGSYNVSLTVSDGNCSNTMIKIITVLESPVADFSVTTACINNPYLFLDQSSSNEGNIISWYWDFGNGDHSHAEDTLYAYDTAGNYFVSLTILTDSGCTDVTTHQLTVVNTAATPDYINLYLPVDSFVSIDDDIYFTWNNSANAVSYTLVYSTDPAFSSNVTTIQNISANFYQDTLSSENTYYWHVIAYGICGDQVISNTFTFTYFSLNSISGLQLWLMGDSIHLNGATVDTIFDCSGNNFNAVQNNNNQQPQILTLPIINDHSVLRFDGINDLLDGVTIPNLNNSSISIFVFFKGDAQSGVAAGFFEINNNTNGYSFYRRLYEENLAIVNNSVLLQCGSLPNAGFNYKILEGIKTFNVKTELFINGIIQGSSTDAILNGPFTNDNYHIGYFQGFDYLKGDIAEIILYSSALSTTERQNIEGYLHYKYSPPPVNLGPDITVNNLCPVSLDASLHYVDYAWNTGEDTSAISIDTSGTYWVSVNDVFGATSIDTVIVSKPAVTVYSDTICYGNDTLLHAGFNTPYTTLWEWGTDSTWSESYTINAGDSIMLHVFDTSGCSVDRLITMYPDSFPLTDLLGAAGLSKCAGDTVFPAQDTGQFVTYNWWDGSTNTSLPYFIVPASWVGPGSGTLTLTCTNTKGCSATDIVTVGVPGYAPLAAFSADAGCEPFISHFTDLTTVTGATPAQWTWDFGDGGNSISQNPNHSFTDAGIHLVTLTVVSSKGCSTTVMDTAFVYSVPEPYFSPILGCSGVPLQFNDHSGSVLGEVSSWTWEFNDPYSSDNSSVLESPEHTYDSSGYYWVVLTDTTEFGCTATDSLQVHIRPAPNVQFSYTDVCEGNPVYFTNDTDPGLGIYQMWWDFSGETLLLENPVYTFEGAGTFPVILVVQSINGCTVRDTQMVVVHSVPLLQFDPPDTLCESYFYPFDENSTVLLPDSITAWLWDFGSLGSFSEQHPDILFPAAGDYPFTLTITSSAGCTASGDASVHVNAIPSASFLPDEFYGMPPFTVNFDNSSTGSGMLNSYWDFGDTTFSTLTNPEHIYTEPDTFTVMLVVTNNALCTDTAWLEIYAISTTGDVAVTNVTTEENGEFLTVSADIWNFGTRKIYELYLYAKASGGTMFMESWSDYDNPLLPMSSMPYTFNAQFAIPEEQSLDYICVEAQIQNYNPDDAPENNEECTTFSNNFSAFIPYPAPTNNEVNIDFILPFKEQVSIDLYGIKGELIKNIFNGEAEKGLNKIAFDISDLNMGVYVYRITFNEDFRILRFVKY